MPTRFTSHQKYYRTTLATATISCVITAASASSLSIKVFQLHQGRIDKTFAVAELTDFMEGVESARPRSISGPAMKASDDRYDAAHAFAETNSRLTTLLRFAAMLGQALPSPPENKPARITPYLTPRELELRA